MRKIRGRGRSRTTLAEQNERLICLLSDACGVLVSQNALHLLSTDTIRWWESYKAAEQERIKHDREEKLAKFEQLKKELGK